MNAHQIIEELDDELDNELESDLIAFSKMATITTEAGESWCVELKPGTKSGFNNWMSNWMSILESLARGIIAGDTVKWSNLKKSVVDVDAFVDRHAGKKFRAEIPGRVRDAHGQFIVLDGQVVGVVLCWVTAPVFSQLKVIPGVYFFDKRLCLNSDGSAHLET